MTSHINTMLKRLCFGLLVCAVLTAPGEGEEQPPVNATPEPVAPVEPEEFTDDLIILKSELAVEGKVIRKTRDAVYILVDYGVLSIPRSKIRSIELNMKSRLSALEEGDNVGRYRVALAALEEGNFLQAEDVLKGLIGKEGVPPEIHKKLAGIYETRGELAKALEHWKLYSLARPGDKDAKKRIAELEKKVAPTVAGKPQPENGGGPTVAKPKHVEGLEANGKWVVQHWGNKAVLTTTDLEGNKVLSLEIAANGAKDKTAISRPGAVDLAAKEKLSFRIFSAEKGRVEVALAVETPAGWFESRPVSVRPDWNTGLSINLRSSRFKSEKTKWRFETRILQPEQVKQVHLLIYCGRRKALLYFDGITIE